MDTLRATDALGADWVVAVLLLVMGVLAWVNMVSPKKWRLLAGSFFGFRLGKQLMRDELDLQDRTLVGLLAMSSALVALFAYQSLVLHGWIGPGPAAYGRAFLVVMAVMVAQVLLVRGLGSLLKVDSGLAEYLYTLVLFDVVLGLLLVPVTTVLAFPYRPEWRLWSWRVGLLLVALVILFRWVRAAVIGVGEGVPLRYIFIYLCTAEILPAALAYEQARHFVPTPSHPL